MKKNKPAEIFPTSSKSSSAELAYQSVIRLLARRDHSLKELQQKLSRRFTPEAARAALARAQERKYLRSPEELSRIVSEALHARTKSLRHIQMELKKRGLPPAPIDTDREKSKCREQLLRKFGEIGPQGSAERVKAYRYLTYRGFDPETINSVLKNKSE